MKHVITLGLLFSLFMVASDKVGAAPQSVYYQGELLDEFANPVDTTVDMTFTIYDALTGGSTEWTETQTAVSVVGGIFSVYLGDVVTLLPSVFSGTGSRYLGFKVGGDSEMVPRSLIASVPSAMRAGIAEDVIDTSITESKIRGNSISRDKLQEKAVGRGQLGDTAVGRGQLGDTAVGRSQIADAAIGHGQIDLDAIDAQNIMDQSISFDDIAQNGAAPGEIMKWDGADWISSEDDIGLGDANWILTGNVLFVGGEWGLAKSGATMYGVNDSTHVNLGSNSTTGTNGSHFFHAVVGGGAENTASGPVSTVSGGRMNIADGEFSTVSGGYLNMASGDSSVVAGGALDTASGAGSTVGGGIANIAWGQNSVVAGGGNNKAESFSSTVSGGNFNISANDKATVGGGENNNASGGSSTISGGISNQAMGSNAAIGGGETNTISFGTISGTIGGGSENQVNESYATVPGGFGNTADAAYSFAAGREASANHTGAFVWADGSGASGLGSLTDNQFVVRAGGGIWLGTNSSVTSVGNRFIETSTGAYLSNSGTWTNASSRNLKENLEPVNGEDLLTKLSELPVSRWNYIADEDELQHIGPMAQDFKRLFGVGSDDESISTIDPSGIALAAIQTLHLQNKRLAQLMDEQAEQIRALQHQIDALSSSSTQERTDD